jgi:energy-coupling factor transport system permease protein
VDIYLPHSTPIHRLDSRAKVFGLAAIFALLLCFNHPAYVAGPAAAVLALAAAARALPNLWRLRALFLILFLFSAALWPVFTRGQTEIARLGPLVLTRESLLYGLAVGLRLDAMVAAGLVFLSTTRVEEFTAALRRLGLPYPVSFAFSLAFRFVPTFVDAAYTIIQAQQSRGLDLESGGTLTRIRRHVPLLVPAVIGAVRSTDVLAMALESRGFGASTPRTDYLQLRARPVDFVVLALLLAAVVLALWWRLSGHGAVLSRV